MLIGEVDEYFTAVKTRAPVCRYEALTFGEPILGQGRSGQLIDEAQSRLI